MAAAQSTRIDISHVVKLGDDNYKQWRLQITVVFKAAGIWDVPSGITERTESNADDFDRKDIRAQAYIIPTLNAVNANHIYHCKSSKEILNKLKQIHSDASTLNKQHTL